MARKRTSKSKTQTTDGTMPNESEQTITMKGTVRNMAGLTAEQIQALLGKTRQKGLYVQKLNEFLDSGEMGISVKETWIEFRDKKDSTLKQGFDNAKDNKEAKEGSEHVKVVSNDGDVNLINLTVVAEQLGSDALAAVGGSTEED